MTLRRLLLSEAAVRDVLRRTEVLRRERGAAFAADWAEVFVAWLERIAEGGAQLGTAHLRRPGVRVFGWRRQASVLAEFARGNCA